MGRFEAAADRLAEIPYEPVVLSLLRHSNWFAPMAEVSSGARHLEALIAAASRQRRSLRNAGISWLLEPETWEPPARIVDGRGSNVCPGQSSNRALGLPDGEAPLRQPGLSLCFPGARLRDRKHSERRPKLANVQAAEKFDP